VQPSIRPSESRVPRCAHRSRQASGRSPALPDDDVLGEQPDADRPLQGELLRARNRLPVVDQHRIIDHGTAPKLACTAAKDGARAGRPQAKNRVSAIAHRHRATHRRVRRAPGRA
jgi:hypothetical protein